MDDISIPPKKNILAKVVTVFGLLAVIGLSTALVLYGPRDKPIVTELSETSKETIEKIAEVIPTIQKKVPTSYDQLITQTYAPLLKYAIRSGRIKTRVAAEDAMQNLSPETIQTLNDLDRYMRTEGTSYRSGKAITLWFDNFSSEKYSLQERRSLAEDRMIQLKGRVEQRELTIDEAGAELLQDESLQDIDSSWQSNALSDIKYAKKDYRTFLDPDIESAFWESDEGVVSPLMIFNKIGATGEPEAGFVFFQITKRFDSEYDTYGKFISDNQ